MHGSVPNTDAERVALPMPAPQRGLTVPGSMPVIEVDDLFKSYGALNAVRGISFQVHEGEVFALLGANGAGKTSTR